MEKWKEELFDNMDRFIIHRRDDECICDYPELDLQQLYPFIEKLLFASEFNWYYKAKKEFNIK